MQRAALRSENFLIPSAVDLSEQLEAPQVFVVEGVDRNLSSFLGGNLLLVVLTP